MNSIAFEKSRDVHIDPVPTKVFISQAARYVQKKEEERGEGEARGGMAN